MTAAGKRYVPALLLFLLAAFANIASAEDADVLDLPPAASAAGPDLADVFDFSQATKPRPGDWLEYLVAFPADPLESSLRNAAGPLPAPPSADAADPDPGAPAQFQPVFEPPTTWRIVPVRLQIREVDDDGCNAELTFAGQTVPVRLDASPREAQAEFTYDAGGEAERVVRIGGAEYRVREVRRTGSGYGFVRWFSAEIPFGTVRFATGHVDVQLVATGRGAPPDEFPSRSASGIAPALGSLY